MKGTMLERESLNEEETKGRGVQEEVEGGRRKGSACIVMSKVGQ